MSSSFRCESWIFFKPFALRSKAEAGAGGGADQDSPSPPCLEGYIKHNLILFFVVY